VFDISPDGDFANFDVYIMNMDGSNVRRLTDAPGGDGSPTWSPDGRWIAFRSDRDTPPGAPWLNTEIYVMRPDGSQQTRLTHHFAPGSWFLGDDDFPDWGRRKVKDVEPSPAGGARWRG
jgi:Tol biopolymer transport system component